MAPPSHPTDGTTAGGPGGPRPEADIAHARHRRAAQLADRITGIIRTLDALDLTGVEPAPVFTVTAHGASSARRPL